MIEGTKIGIPVTGVGDCIRKLNEALKANNMALKAESDIGVCFYKDENTAIGLKLEVVLLRKDLEGEKEIN